MTECNLITRYKLCLVDNVSMIYTEGPELYVYLTFTEENKCLLHKNDVAILNIIRINAKLNWRCK